MIETLISSKTRIKLLLKFFLNSSTTAYLRNLESEFGESSNAIRLELNKLEEAGMLSSFSAGNKKMFQANSKHPLFGDIHSILMKYIGLDQIVEKIVTNLGELDEVYLSGDFAKGLDSSIIDLIFIGNNINKSYLMELVEKSEKLVKRKIRYIIYSKVELNIEAISDKAILLLWSNEK
jgi:hypothetical protein